MDGVEVLIPIVAIFCIFGAPVLAFSRTGNAWR